MDDWLTRGGSRDYPATWGGLYSLLNDLGYGNIAVKLMKAVSGTSLTLKLNLLSI